jgi:hypothetical protein
MAERPIGFSTGALACGDFRRGLELARHEGASVVELSALRVDELRPLVEALDDLDLSGFEYVGFHAPSAIPPEREQGVVEALRCVAERFPVIVHPDAIHDFALWHGFGESLCLENMDKRKPDGRDVAGLREFFAAFPEASFCLDLGHARQVDPTMIEACLLLRAYGERLKQIHLSEVTTASKHERLSWSSIQAFREVAHLIPEQTPIILESVIGADEVGAEIGRARRSLMSARQFAEPRAAGRGEQLSA